MVCILLNLPTRLKAKIPVMPHMIANYNLSGKLMDSGIFLRKPYYAAAFKKLLHL
jgi:hypothetical protein